jgi:hypothetical protein
MSRGRVDALVTAPSLALPVAMLPNQPMHQPGRSRRLVAGWHHPLPSRRFAGTSRAPQVRRGRHAAAPDAADDELGGLSAAEQGDHQ